MPSLPHCVRGTCLCLEQTTLDVAKFGIKVSMGKYE